MSVLDPDSGELANGVSIDTTVSLGAYEGRQINLTFMAVDSIGQRRVVVEVFIESSPLLQEYVSVDGPIVDADSTRVLFKSTRPASTADGTDSLATPLVVRDLTSGIEVPIFQDSSTLRDENAFLTPVGAIFITRKVAYPYHDLWEWRSGGATVLLSENPVGGSLRTAGNYAVWNDGGGLFRRELDSSTNTLVHNSAGNSNNDVAANGAVAFWAGDQVFLRRGDVTTQLSQGSEFAHTYPRTDGTSVVARFGSGGLEVFDESGSRTVLSQSGFEPQPDSHYSINNRWVAFGLSGPYWPYRGEIYLWLRSPTGNFTQVSSEAFSKIDALGPSGDVMFIAHDTRMIAWPNSSAVRVSSRLGSVRRLEAGWFVIIGRSLFRVVSEPVVTQHPSDRVAMPGELVTLTAAATGLPPPTAQWQVSVDAGLSWSDIAGQTETSYSFTASLADDGHRYRAVFTNPSGRAATDNARLSVKPGLSLTPQTLVFAGTNAAGVLHPLTPPQTVAVLFSGGGTAAWTATADQPWVQLSNAAADGAGAGSGTLVVSIINPNNVLAGVTQATATVTVAAPGAANSPQTVTVRLSLQQAGTTEPAFGQIDTPAQNATGIQGAIGVTGWALDDVGVAGVTIYRNCVPFENQAACQVIDGLSVVFVGEAVFVAGARPDVEAAFQGYPQGNRAGWGYMVLTNMLPHIPQQAPYGGQGTFTLYAVATDAEGHRTWLGRDQFDHTPTTITCTNDTIAKPFGAIDTPGQGATVSGTTFGNYGWALTPDADTVADATDIRIHPNGSTMFVFIDGVATATILYDQCRGTVGTPVPAGLYCDDDVANIFGNSTPQPTFTPRSANPTRYRNLDQARSAIGAYYLDTAALTNGLHSIAWSVTDSAGRTEGIGSRFFTVLNSGADAAPRTPAAAVQALRADAIDIAAGSVLGRVGFDLGAPLEEVLPGADGVRSVFLRELSRLELHLGPVASGHLVANDERRELPTGSHLDVGTGVFTWAPAPGLYGTYRLVFVGEASELPIDVTIRPVTPAAAGESEIRMALDAPAEGAVVSGPIHVAGWALDPQAWNGSGIGAVHVWAVRTDVPGVPVFLGAASLGLDRPDVARDYGAQFGTAGFVLSTSGLAPGDYDLTAYVWNRRTARWEDARSVTVMVR